jgi:ATP-dependent RNA helicase DeaD
MLDMLKRKKVDVSEIRWLVLDEADEMLNMGFKEELNAILTSTPADKRVLLFSATMPRDIEAIAHSYMRKPKEITVGGRNTGAENVDHQYYVVHAKDRYAALKRIVDYYPDIYAIVFCRTRTETQEVADALMKDGYNADALHGDLSQTQRDSVMNRFRSRNLQLLVATDVAARGIDVVDVDSLGQVAVWLRPSASLRRRRARYSPVVFDYSNDFDGFFCRTRSASSSAMPGSRRIGLNG